MNEKLKHFYDYACDVLELPEDNRPEVSYNSMGSTSSFGGYDPNSKKIHVTLKNRHFMDIARTLAHEMVHHKQHITVGLKKGDGDTGSEIENEANSTAGVIMRGYGRKYPENFTEKVMITESFYQKIAKKLKRKSLDEEFTDSMGNEYIELGLTVRDKKGNEKTGEGSGVGQTAQVQ